MLIDLKLLCDKYKFLPKGIFHVGAHKAEEFGKYSSLGINNVVWVEANEKLIATIKNIVPENQKVLNYLVSDIDGDNYNFNITNNGESSSLLDLEKHKIHHPHIYVTESVNMESKTLDTIIKLNGINLGEIDFLNLDIQGAELMALKGMKNNLRYINYIYTEVNTAHLYKDCALMKEIDCFLKNFGFDRVETNMTQFEWGDAFYIKSHDPKKTLDEIGIQYNTDKSSNFHNYLSIYENYFYNIRGKRNNVLEIGILNGDSLKMFAEYFYNSKMFAVDIEDKKNFASDNIKIFTADQSDKNFLNLFENDYFDVIIDDGSHKMEHQQISFGILFKKLKSSGVYIIEDLHTSVPEYIENINFGNSKFGLNDDRSNTTLKFLNELSINNGSNYYLTPSEYTYLKDNIKELKIFQTLKQSNGVYSITSVIIKK